MKKLLSIVVLVIMLVFTWSTFSLAQGGVVHVVKNGEALSSIAVQYGMTVSQLMSANNIHDPNMIWVGQRLVISGATFPANQFDRFYTVKSGDTLSGIAEKLGVSLAMLVAANHISETDFIVVGVVLRVPGYNNSIGHEGYYGVRCNNYYNVRSGDTLSGIAYSYGTTVSQLTQLNNLRSYFIYAGQRLCLPMKVYHPPVRPKPTAYPTPSPTPNYPTVVLTPVHTPFPIKDAPRSPLHFAPQPATTHDVSTCFEIQQVILPSVPNPLDGGIPPAPEYVEDFDTELVPVTVVRAVNKWCGRVVSRESDPDNLASVVVEVPEHTGMLINLKIDNVLLQGSTGEAGNAPFDYLYRSLQPGRYSISIGEGISGAVIFSIERGQRVHITFEQTSASEVPRPAAQTGWSGYITSNTSTIIPYQGPGSLIIVRGGGPGSPFLLQSEGGYSVRNFAGSKPEHGDNAAEFGGLSPGRYRITFEGADIAVEVFVDGAGIAEVIFDLHQ